MIRRSDGLYINCIGFCMIMRKGTQGPIFLIKTNEERSENNTGSIRHLSASKQLGSPRQDIIDKSIVCDPHDPRVE